MALLFGIGGLLILLVAVQRSELPLVRASHIVPTMNFGRVRLQGAVASAPRVFDRQGRPDYVSFDLDDGTGRITVAASRRVAQRLVDANLLPSDGQRVEVAGSLSLAPQRRPRLYLDSPSQIHVLAMSAGKDTSP
jgi:DNA/RNA endonuclease YhcR with UshA esterase domain